MGLLRRKQILGRLKKGTNYRNQNKDGIWSEYTMAEFKENEMFTMDKDDNNYHVRYIFTPVNKSICELEYYEWVG